MRPIKHQVIEAGFGFFKATGLHRGLAPLTRGQGAILMLHHVRPAPSDAFQPNALLEIEPAFLDAALGRIAALGYDLVSMDEASRRLGRHDARPFVAVTFDDGYRSLVAHALPVLERHRAPFAAYVTTGFADRTARLWWVELEEAIRVLDHVDVEIGPVRVRVDCIAPRDKSRAFDTLYTLLRQGPEERLLATIAALLATAGIDGAALVTGLCLDWSGIRALARHPLCTIGAHTQTHPMLAKHDANIVRAELAEGRARIETAIGLPVRHLAYPVGDLSSAGPRDYAIAATLGFTTAVTTRPGMIFPAHDAHRCGLPRLSLNGLWQDVGTLDVLLSGVPFALWNKGRRIVA